MPLGPTCIQYPIATDDTPNPSIAWTSSSWFPIMDSLKHVTDTAVQYGGGDTHQGPGTEGALYCRHLSLCGYILEPKVSLGWMLRFRNQLMRWRMEAFEVDEIRKGTKLSTKSQSPRNIFPRSICCICGRRRYSRRSQPLLHTRMIILDE